MFYEWSIQKLARWGVCGLRGGAAGRRLLGCKVLPRDDGVSEVEADEIAIEALIEPADCLD